MNTTRTMIGTPDPDDGDPILITTHGGEVVGASYSVGMGGAATPPVHLGGGGSSTVPGGGGGGSWHPRVRCGFRYPSRRRCSNTATNGDRCDQHSEATGVEVVQFAEAAGVPLEQWQRDVVELAHQVDARPAQRPHKRRRRHLGGSSVRWGRAIVLGGTLGPLTGLLIVGLT